MDEKELDRMSRYEYDKAVLFLAKVAQIKGITVSEIARRTGMAQPNVFRFFNGDGGSNVRTFVKIAHALGYKVKLQ